MKNKIGPRIRFTDRKHELLRARVRRFRSKEKGEAQPYTGVCCEACYYAKGERCTCKCEGKHHGKGLREKRTLK